MGISAMRGLIRNGDGHRAGAEHRRDGEEQSRGSAVALARVLLDMTRTTVSRSKSLRLRRAVSRSAAAARRSRSRMAPAVASCRRPMALEAKSCKR
jgi:hypothetical protein